MNYRRFNHTCFRTKQSWFKSTIIWITIAAYSPTISPQSYFQSMYRSISNRCIKDFDFHIVLCFNKVQGVTVYYSCSSCETAVITSISTLVYKFKNFNSKPLPLTYWQFLKWLPDQNTNIYLNFPRVIILFCLCWFIFRSVHALLFICGLFL